MGKKTVGVAMGGLSREREISLESGHAVLKALSELGLRTVALDPLQENWHRPLLSGEVDVVFNAIHGHPGEDGVLQGFLEMLGIPYTGSGVLASALAMDKLKSKRLWRSCGLPTPPWVELKGPASIEEAVSRLGLPLIVKPAAEGSSIGVSRIESPEELEARLGRSEGERLFAERWIEGKEYTAAFVGDRWLPLVRIETGRDFFDYEAKYLSEETRYWIPSGLPPEEERRLQELSRKACEILSVEGWGRVDLMVDREGEPWLLEVNTVPGLTPKSLVPKAARAAGIAFPQLIEMILETV